MARGTVLCIDDEPMVTEAIRRVLAHRFETTVVDDARLGYDLLVTGARFDVIVCDVYMPMLDGMRFYDKVAELDPAQAARIIFLTGATNQPKVREFLARVPNRRVEKPFSPSALEAMIEALVPVLH